MAMVAGELDDLSDAVTACGRITISGLENGAGGSLASRGQDNLVIGEGAAASIGLTMKTRPSDISLKGTSVVVVTRLLKAFIVW